WEDLRGFLSQVEERGLALNYSTLVGQGSIRAAAMGFGGRRPTTDELELMKKMVTRSMEQGALGLSTGLEYTPGSSADAGEIIELCRSIAPYKGVYATHMRDEEDGVLEALDEAIRISRGARVKLQISHLKVGRPRNWPKVDRALAKIEQARAEGIDVFCDRYPYIASATDLSVFFPLWSREDGTDAFISRLKDPAFDACLRADVAEQEKGIGSWDKVVISSVSSDVNRWTQGKNVVEAARRAGKEPYEFMRDLLIEEKSRVGMISFYGNEDVLKRILAHPLAGVGSDGSAVAPYGILNKGNPHPRLYGTFPRFMGKYVRGEKLLPLEEAVRKITSLPASHFGFSKRGVLAAGCHADIVVFDPDKILDLATWNEPARYPAGIRYVIVNGVVVVDGEEHTGKLPGKVLRKQRQGSVI
ncbi:MAG TPA: amidohydrolase family protein, partial [Candidatus Aminicenantes bacterium]|nr:amidohydrolase family protein [Candidatus Aminicenantes bacterium]